MYPTIGNQALSTKASVLVGAAILVAGGVAVYYMLSSPVYSSPKLRRKGGFSKAKTTGRIVVNINKARRALLTAEKELGKKIRKKDLRRGITRKDMIEWLRAGHVAYFKANVRAESEKKAASIYRRARDYATGKKKMP